MPCGHLLGEGWPLVSRLWCLTVSLLLSHWYSGSGVVLYCIDSWSLHPYFNPSSKIFLLYVPMRCFFCGSFVLFMSCVRHTFASVHCCLVVTCLERADLLHLVCNVKLWFYHFPMWYPGSGVAIDCIDSWSLPSFLLSILIIATSFLILSPKYFLLCFP